jgi:antitoxin protein of toxin-antitoxin system
MSFLDKIKELLSKNTDKVDAAIDKAGDLLDQKTGDKYKGAVDKVQDVAKKAVDGTKAPESTAPETKAPETTAPETPAAPEAPAPPAS